VEAAEDATQGFFVHVLENDLLPRVDPARGRFRSYLLTSLTNYLANQYEREQARKRGGGTRVVPIDAPGAELELPALPDDPGRAFDREWAVSLLERAVARLEGEYREGRRKGPAEVFLRFFALEEEPPSYAEAAAACGLTTVQFKAALHRARQRFREILHEEIADTLEATDDPEAEMRTLLAALT
jgi:RNA polymerase sigma-70 factor (ECF subfamily)